MDVRALQEPLKAGYRNDPQSGRITLTARGGQVGQPIGCSIDLGRAQYAAQAHAGVGGEGTGACSGDLLLGALAACAQITCQMVAASMGLDVRNIAVTAEGDLDLRGTLGVDRAAPVGFTDIRLGFAVDAPAATPEELEGLRRRTERYCVVLQTLAEPPPISTSWPAAEVG
jgi:uncharacterized OsmC-like protein